MMFIYNALNDTLKKKDLPLVELDLMSRAAGRPISEILRFKIDVLNSTVREVEQDVFNAYMQYCSTECKLFPDVKRILRFFKSKGIKIGLLTTTPRMPLENVVKRFGLKNFLDLSI